MFYKSQAAASSCFVIGFRNVFKSQKIPFGQSYLCVDDNWVVGSL